MIKNFSFGESCSAHVSTCVPTDVQPYAKQELVVANHTSCHRCVGIIDNKIK